MVSWDDYKLWLGDKLIAQTWPAGTAPQLKAWVTDSRTIKNDQWFVPIVGEKYDGHQYIAEAMSKGAEGFVYAEGTRAHIPESLKPRGISVIDTLEAFQLFAAGWRQQLKTLKLIGLTGSAGKTTTKEMLSRILQVDGPTLATQASFNNEVGVPKTLQALTADLRYAALEFGARKPGNIKFLCEMARPDVVGLINVGTAHLGVFGSLQALLETKTEIFRNSPSHATQVSFYDDPRILKAAKETGKKTITFGTSPGADVFLADQEWQPDGSMRIRLRFNGALSHLSPIPAINIPVSHEMFPINAAAAAALALAAGAQPSSIVEGLTRFRGIRGRYYLYSIGSSIVVDDTYNANPESMAAGLNTVHRAYRGRPIVVVLGDMLELGNSSRKAHEFIGESLIARQAPAFLITVGKEAKHIATAAAAAGYPNSRSRSFDHVDDLLASNLDIWSLGEVLYAKGSNSMHLNKLIESLVGDQK